MLKKTLEMFVSVLKTGLLKEENCKAHCSKNKKKKKTVGTHHIYVVVVKIQSSVKVHSFFPVMKHKKKKKMQT